jgi:hypothetical protein
MLPPREPAGRKRLSRPTARSRNTLEIATGGTLPEDPGREASGPLQGASGPDCREGGVASVSADERVRAPWGRSDLRCLKKYAFGSSVTKRAAHIRLEESHGVVDGRLGVPSKTWGCSGLLANVVGELVRPNVRATPPAGHCPPYPLLQVFVELVRNWRGPGVGVVTR